MKFLKIFLAVLLLAAGGLLLIGVFVPEVDDRFETRVNRPVMQVFAGMMSLQDLPEWVEGLYEVERTGGFLAMPGSTFNLHYNGTETEVVYELEILEIIPLESVKFRLHNEMMEFVVSIRFKEVDGVTVMDSFVQMKGKALVSRSFIPLMKTVIMDEGKRNLERFKQLQEQPK